MSNEILKVSNALRADANRQTSASLDEINQAEDMLMQMAALREERDRLAEALWNAMGHLDTPIARRKLAIEHDTEWLIEARQALAPAKRRADKITPPSASNL